MERQKEKALSFDKAFLGEFGRCERIRTSDPLHPMQMRYLAALHTDGVSSADGEGVYGDAPTLSTGEIPVRDRLPALRATSDQSASSRAFCQHLAAVLRNAFKQRSAVEGEPLAQYLIGDLTVLPGDLAVD